MKGNVLDFSYKIKDFLYIELYFFFACLISICGGDKETKRNDASPGLTWDTDTKLFKN